MATFCQEHGFQDREALFFSGALAAQNPRDLDNVDELTTEEKVILGREVTHRWHLPKQLYYTIALCSLGSAVQGWDNTGANGANLSFPAEFAIEDNSWLLGLINAVCMNILTTSPEKTCLGTRRILKRI